MTYTYLALKRYMSEVENYKKITLGSTEELFLGLIAGKEMTAYNIYSGINEGKRAYERQMQKGEEDDYEDMVVQIGTEGMAYKNVHLRIKKLYKLGLIEKTGKKQPRRAIKYKITTRGLFQCLLAYARPEVLFLHKDNIILKTILYEFFEVETVKELMSIFGDNFFHDYLKKCCQQTLQVFEDIYIQEHEKNKALEKMWPYYYPDKLEAHRMDVINDILNRQANNLVYEIVVASTNLDYEDKFPNSVISSDKKFLESLQYLEKTFQKGIKNFL